MFATLKKLFPVKTIDVEAKLKGVGGYTGRGEVEYALWSSGRQKFEVELKGVAGRQAKAFAHEECVATIDIKDGKAETRLDTKNGDELPNLAPGERIEIRQNGDVILEGVLQPDD